MFTEIIAILRESPGLLIGLGFVLAATALLPARMRWYVFTAGMAVVIFRAWQIYSARGRLKVLDAEREHLRAELQGLRARSADLEAAHKALLGQLDQLKKDRDALVEQRKTLDATAADAELQRRNLDAALEAKQAAAASLHEQTRPIVDFLESFADADRLTANIPGRP